MKKLKYFTLACALFGATYVVPVSAQSAASVRDLIYQYAVQGNVAQLQRLKRLGYSLDALDLHGNTAYCQAIWMQQRRAIKTLRAAGADRRPDCLKSIPIVTVDMIYDAATVGDLDQLVEWKKADVQVDVVDLEDGNSALCKAVYDQDCTAIQTLLRAGALEAQACMRRIPQAVREELECKSKEINWRVVGYSALGAATVGGVVALVAGGHGGGGHGGGNSGSGSGGGSQLAEVTSIPAVVNVNSCPAGSNMTLVNGVCSCRDGQILVDGVCTDKTASNTPAYLAEDGASVSNTETLNYLVGSSKRLVAMQANGVNASALKGDRVYLKGASRATNESSGQITMQETSATNGGVFGMYATAAGTINNDGQISITSVSSAESAGMKVDRDDQYEGGSGAGANITQNGTISVTKKGDGTGTASAVSAPGRGVTNNGSVTLNLATEKFDVSAQHGTVQGIYGKSVLNKGDLTLKSNAKATVNADVYLARGHGDKGSVVINDGTVAIDLTNVAYGIYGVWADKGSEVSIENTGTIDVSGILYNRPDISKQVYLLGSDSGISTVKNSGAIQVGTSTTPIDVSSGGVIDAMYLNQGTMTNDSTIDFHLKMDPTKDSGIFSAYAMELEQGTLVNNGDIKYSFTNKKSGTYTATKPTLNLAAISLNTGTATNNKNIEANLTGSASSGSYTAMDAISASLTNNQTITAKSDMDNVGLTGLKASGGSIVNSEKAVIQLVTSGQNAPLVGGDTWGASEGVESRNDGYVYLTHNGGSGNILGFSATNNGLIQIQANDMTGSNFITGGQAITAVSENVTQELTDEEQSEANAVVADGSTASEPTKAAIGKINIALKGTTAGTVFGFDYGGGATSAPAHASASTINITADSTTRAGDLGVLGLRSVTTGRSDRADGIVSTVRDGILNINVTGSPTYETLVCGMAAYDANLINMNTSVVNVNVNLNGSTKHGIFGMYVLDSSVDSAGTSAGIYGGYKGVNAGTLNIDVDGNTHAEAYDSKMPFDVVGMITNSYVLNTGTINLNVESSSAKTAGMVACDGGVIINQGVIRFTGNADNFIPMYATGHRQLVEGTVTTTTQEGKKLTTSVQTTTDYYATVYNSGKIVINNVIGSSSFTPSGAGYYTNATTDTNDPAQSITVASTAEDVWARKWEVVTEVTCEGDECKPEDSKRDVENHDTRGHFTAFPSGSQTMALGQGVQYVASAGGTIEGEGIHFVGAMTAGTDLVQGSNADNYVAAGQGEGVLIGDGSTKDLGIASGSVLFTANYATNQNNPNGINIVMNRRSFTDLVEKTSLAQFLEQNYVKGNNVAFFDQLKGFDNIHALNAGLDKMIGQNMLSRFNFEDLTMMKELNFDMNEQLFHNRAQTLAVAGAVSPFAFRSDTTSGTTYSLYNRRNGKMSVGLGVAFTKIHSANSHHDDSRNNMMYQLVVPIGYQTHGFNLMVSPRVGYARGHYDRTGFDNTSYDGTLEKRVFGLMNEARYPISVGKWIFEPAFEFNALGYEQRGREDKKAFSLNIPTQRTYSVESGIGLYASHETELNKDSKLRLTAGVAAYHEFADPYMLNVGMNGMTGHFTLRDDEHSDNRVVTRLSVNYDHQDYSLYGSFISYWDQVVRSKANLGLKWKF